MSEKLCALRKIGGGTLKETTLWTNSNPTSSFGAVTLTLPQPITNFDYIKINYKPRAELDASSAKGLIVSVDEFVQMINNVDTCNIALGAVINSGGRIYLMIRRIIYNNSTEIYIDQTAPQGTNGIFNTTCVPINIIGIKM